MKDAILQLVHQAHALTETAAVEALDPQERKKFILADLSLHMVQAALRHPQPQAAEVRRYLFSVLTVCDGFVPDLDLKAMAEVLLPPSASTSEQ
ncbi:hypothetical protein ACW9KT_00140 [Hymenobacter sp. HD11105]|jgi:hypothetical protein